MCGGQPGNANTQIPKDAFSPHARGSTLSLFTPLQECCIHPACAGVNPRSWRRLTARKNSPPHARGSTWQLQDVKRCTFIFPACAGVNPTGYKVYSRVSYSPRMRGVNPAPPVLSKGISDSPRMRGGHPNFGCWKSKNTQFTPHARGSTQPRQFSLFPCNGIHPACAGVNPFHRLAFRWC